MKIVIDIPEDDYEYIKLLHEGLTDYQTTLKLYRAVKNGKPLPNITDEQISDAFQIAIANYWESKSKYLTPPPTPCDCPIKKKEADNE